MKKDEDKIFIDEFCEKVAKKSKVSEEKSAKFIHTLFDYIGDSIEKEDKVQIYQFGIFKKKWASEKPGINPQTKEKIMIPAHYKISFHPSSLLANEVNKKYRNLKPNVLDEILTITGLRRKNEEVTKEYDINQDLKIDHSRAKKRALITLIVSGVILLLLIAAIILIPAYYVNEKNKNEDNKVIEFVTKVNQMLGLNTISDAISGGKKEEINAEKVTQFIAESKKNLSEDRKIIDTYTVKEGDSIFSIAKHYWQDEYLWPDLYLLNKSDFSDPDMIHPNDKIVIYEKLGDPNNFKKSQKDKIVQAYIGIYRIYRALGEKEINEAKVELKNPKIKKNIKDYYQRKLKNGEKRLNDSTWTLYTAARYDHDILKKYKDAIYPDDIETLTKYIERFGYQGKKDEK